MKMQRANHVVRYQRGRITHEEDLIVTEHPVTLKVNGEELATLVCSPEYIEDMAIGYLASEGMIKEYADIQELWVQEEEGFVHIRTERWNPLHQKMSAKRYITSCCGMSRSGFVFFNDARNARIMDGVNVKLTFEDCFRLMNDVLMHADLFRRTGGVHNAALCDHQGILLARCDIGRHNALDKIYGHCLKHGLELKDKIIAFSGRISSEILLKVAKIGCEVVLSKSAPTALALDLADQLGITTVGFIRNDSCNVYTHPERIADYEDTN
ncbi:formate dehydrogenase accessory sulfurtransferase FdhD [Paenibacillus sp. CAA11]|uniref:formate dehydrogenase accessory sulfurtransferase FdhD n=1 Tax=Paenibacillus sp. CAA11 TaxID=1532905 RepID=UPI000D39B7C4|nr:formate dehydrogenase accessory sulfurtransferase FdhD [Paenibacillus sp. CAA11]AWB45613.1 formate dehydrogenase accessory sulfurtransferase FdhD [Paenibacillus sp. CAA11]